MIIQVGHYVKLNQLCKDDLLEPCRSRGHHQEESSEFCFQCSSEHIEEFGNSIGRVVELDLEFAEARVNWLPGTLKYTYRLKYLQITNITAFL